MATKVKPGDLRSWRKAKRRSFNIRSECYSLGVSRLSSFGAQGNHGVDSRRASRRNPTGDDGGGAEQQADGEVDAWIGRVDFKEQAANQAGKSKRSEKAEEKADREQTPPLAEHQ